MTTTKEVKIIRIPIIVKFKRKDGSILKINAIKIERKRRKAK